MASRHRIAAQSSLQEARDELLKLSQQGLEDADRSDESKVLSGI